MSIESVGLVVISALSAAVWQDLMRRVRLLEDGISPLTRAVAELTIEVRHLSEELTRYRDRDHT